MRHPILLMFIAAASAGQVAAQQATPARVDESGWRAMRWLVGSWRGSGGAYPEFFEDYRLVDDSTMRQRSLADGTFAAATDSSDIEWRGGVVHKLRGGTVRSIVARVAGDTIRFEPRSGSRGGFTWIRVSPDEWIAVLDPAAPAAAPVTYRLRRVAPR